ncbi:DUF2849 domain-containing protein [Mangrovibrevibacter kandeliae]|uniref:DUF2849 domain-containing protein n=1 Tax=Mangrovibrevibacter kandeliae TaxID=2968473 RepID=UPI00211817A9|nr:MULTISPECIES: DUF2849 domain-containing protein [unclassified Aurantimonas]MCQ8781968.1 DUF2849 domain-containing protein [Aurantimonas sp. CSK15Z-1]MCW4115373.1 DUF2849 domain-containing protein [Aurantimonas sp. MSK8Z-1]
MATDAKAGAKGKGPKLPVILSANRLLEGDVVYLTAGGWTLDPASARIASDAETAAVMEAEGAAAAAANLVVDPYLVPVEIDATGFPRATHFREAMRQTGPSIHPDIGKQAEYAH